jgi:hypothetical protein
MSVFLSGFVALIKSRSSQLPGEETGLNGFVITFSAVKFSDPRSGSNLATISDKKARTHNLSSQATNEKITRL